MKSINWSKISATALSYLLSFLSGSLIGAILGRPAAKGQMLAAGAIVMFYMLIGGITALILTVLLLRKRSTSFRWWSVGILTIVFLGVWAALRLIAG